MMLIRSGKIQFLFWTAFFSVLCYLWIVAIGVQVFVLPDENPMYFPQNVLLLLFVLYGILALLIVIGTLVSTMFDSKVYRRFFGALGIVSLLTLLGAKSMFG